jgi:hypothetical protein
LIHFSHETLALVLGVLQALVHEGDVFGDGSWQKGIEAASSMVTNFHKNGDVHAK